jgi:hypothetical protein
VWLRFGDGRLTRPDEWFVLEAIVGRVADRSSGCRKRPAGWLPGCWMRLKGELRAPGADRWAGCPGGLGAHAFVPPRGITVGRAQAGHGRCRSA